MGRLINMQTPSFAAQLAGDGDEYWVFRVNARAMCLLEEQFGMDYSFSEIVRLIGASEFHTHRAQLLWALSVTWRERNMEGLEFDAFLEMLPVGMAFVELTEKAFEYIAKAFETKQKSDEGNSEAVPVTTTPEPPSQESQTDQLTGEPS